MRSPCIKKTERLTKPNKKNKTQPYNLLGKKSELDTTEKYIAHQLDWINFLIRSQKTLLEANTLKSTVA